MSSRLRTRLVKEEYNTGAHNVFHISRLKKAADTAAEAKKLELPRWMRKGFPSKITVEDRDYMYEISGIVGHHDYFSTAKRLEYEPPRHPTVVLYYWPSYEYVL